MDLARNSALTVEFVFDRQDVKGDRYHDSSMKWQHTKSAFVEPRAYAMRVRGPDQVHVPVPVSLRLVVSVGKFLPVCRCASSYGRHSACE